MRVLMLHAHVSQHVCMYVCVCIRTCVCVSMRPGLRSFDVTLMNTPRCKRCLSRSSSLLALCLAWMTYVCTPVYMNACMYDVCMDGWKGECMHLCVYLSMNVCMYVCMYVCMCACVLRATKTAVYECVLKIYFWLGVALPAVSQQGSTSLRSHGFPWSTILLNISYTWLNGRNTSKPENQLPAWGRPARSIAAGLDQA